MDDPISSLLLDLFTFAFLACAVAAGIHLAQVIKWFGKLIFSLIFSGEVEPVPTCFGRLRDAVVPERSERAHHAHTPHHPGGLRYRHSSLL